MRVVLSDKAEFDLIRIYRYLAEHSPRAADAFAERIDANLQNLQQFPFIGRERSGLAPGLRCLIVGLYLIFYTVSDARITVIRVIDGRMDVEEEFRR